MAFHNIKVLAFDVFGTVVDWRSSVIAEGEQLGKAKGLNIDWTAFAEHDLNAARTHGLRTAYVHRPLERGPGKASAQIATDGYDIVADDFADLAKQLGA